MPVQIGGDNRARQALSNPALASPMPSPVQVQPSPMGRSMADLGAGFQNLAGAVRQDQQNRDALIQNKLIAEFQTEAQRRAADLDPLGANYEQEVRRTYDEVGQETMGRADFYSRTSADVLQTNIKVQSEGNLRLALGERHKQIGEQAVRGFNAMADTALGSIRTDPAGTDLYLAQMSANVKSLGAAVPQNVRETLTLKFAQDAIFAQVEGLIAQETPDAFDAAVKVVDAHQGALKPENFVTLKQMIREGKTQASQDLFAGVARQVADAHIATANATTIAGLAAVQRTVEGMDAAGAFDAAHQDTRASLLVGIANQKQQIVNAGRKLSVALGEYQTGFTSRENGDLAFDALVAPYRDDPGKFNAFLDDFVSQTGHVPSIVRASVQRAELAPDPALLAAAAETVKRLQNTGVSPGTDFGTRDTGSRVLQVVAMHDTMGMDYAAAANEVSQQVLDPKVAETRTAGFHKAFGNSGPNSATFDARKFLFDNDQAKTHWFSADDQIPDAAANAFEQMAREFYVQSGNVEVSKAAALARFAQVYGMSATNGTNTLVKYPPERYFPPQVNSMSTFTQDQRTGIVRGEIERGLKAIGIAPATVLGYPEDTSGVPAFSLFADPQTKAEIDRGDPVSYQVLVRGDKGDMRPYPLPDGTFLRYTMPTYEQLGAIPEYAAIVTAQQSKVHLTGTLAPAMKDALNKPWSLPGLGRNGPWLPGINIGGK